eukprot:scaffold26037_cov17-Tisochrysis_lutea.AAC.1
MAKKLLGLRALRPIMRKAEFGWDPTGQLKAAVHRAVLEAEPNFGPGATVSLKEQDWGHGFERRIFTTPLAMTIISSGWHVSLLCPWPGMEYLCITQRNVLQASRVGCKLMSVGTE